MTHWLREWLGKSLDLPLGGVRQGIDLLPEAQLGAPGVLDDVAVTALAVLLVAEAFRGAILSGAP